MVIRTVVVTPFSQNARVLIDEHTRDAVVVDPGGDVAKIFGELELENEPLNVSKVFLTHAHIDHAGGVEPLRRMLVNAKRPKPELLAHPAEKEFRAHVADSALMFGLSPADFEN